MNTRILPSAEYAKLAGTELEAIAAHLPPGAHVVVIEDGAELLACCALIPMVHFECSWVKPSSRGSLVFARLVRAMKQTALAMGVTNVWTASLTEDVTDLALRLGGVELPGRHFAVPVDK